MKKATWVLGVIYVAIGVMAFLVFIQNINLRKINQEFADRNDELNREIGEYQAMEDFYWEYTNLLDKIYRGKINEAVLQERVKWLKEYQEPIVSQQQMYDDFEELIEIIIYYYEHTDQVVALETYVETNYPALYDRIMDY